MFTLTLLVLSSFLTINAFVVLNIKNPTTKYGFVYPNRAEPNSNVTYVLEGVDVLIYLAKVPENYEECKVTTSNAEVTYSLVPDGDDDDSSKVVFWIPDSKTTGCGARIKNVNVSDSGRWRLQAVNEEEDHLYQSFINLRVIKNFNRPDGDFIIREGSFDEFNVTKYAGYCEVVDPVLSGDHKIFEKCQIELEHVNKLYAGKWKAKVGILGKIDEIMLEPKVEVVGESFNVGQNKTGSKINLFCNLNNAVTANVTFCRFIKSGSEFGLRLSEGLSNGDYSYFGRQIKDGDCGVTIENPKPDDYVIWKCSLGVHRLVNNTKIVYEVKEAVISLNKKSKRSVRAAEKEPEVIQEILAALENPLDLNYKTGFQMRYCIFIHPNGTQYAFSEAFHNHNWTTVGNLDAGECGISIFNTTYNETGLWKIQIGQYESHVLDKIIHVPVRVGEKAMVAVNKMLTTGYDSQLTIKCRAVAKKPNFLEYCRFTMPNGKGFQINRKVTEDEPIDGLYWYNGTILESGDCQVTIKKINLEHFGQWYCSGKIRGSKNLEDYDVIDVTSAQISVASISGIAVGSSIAIIVIVGGFIYYRKKKRQQPQRRQTFLTSSSRSSDAVFDRNAPLVSAEAREPEQAETREPEQAEIVMEKIEMSNLSQSRPSTSEQSLASAQSRFSTSEQSRLSTSVTVS